jgi:hypothetical protein
MKKYCKKYLFDLPNDIIFLNCAYQSPKLVSSAKAGENGKFV